jgi:Tol biopolymer transport system component
LTACDLSTETNWLVTKNTDSTWKTIDGWAENSAISPDGKQIAYSWYNEKGIDVYDLRIVDMDGSNMHVLYHDASIFYILPYAWSPDGRDILAYFSEADKSLVDEKTGELFRKAYLVLVSVADGSVRILRTWHANCYPKRAVFSPDGRYVAYDFGQEDDLTRHDIYLMELDGGGEIALIEHPADDRLFGWTPDGGRILFMSYRTSERSLWVIKIADGVAQGSPRALLGQFEGWPIGFTSDGSLYYGLDTTASNVYLARLDPMGLNFQGEPELVSYQFVGSTTMADFSPDGKFLVYRTSQGANWSGPGNWILVVYSVETSGEHIVTPSPPFRKNTRIRGPRFSPDGRSLLVFGSGRDIGRGLYRVDLETGAVTMIDSFNDSFLRQAVWSTDGKSVYIHSGTRIIRVELATGRETELYQGKWCPISIDVSPDGRWISFYRDINSLVVLPSVGGGPREVVHLDDEVRNPHPFVRWTPDGEHLLFSRRKNELWKVNVETGTQQQIGPAIEEGQLMNAIMHPDGRQIAFTVEQLGSELWVMENFLPD